MSTADDRLILTEYTDWLKTLGPFADATARAFLEQRENRFNASRVADALKILNEQIPQFERMERLERVDAQNLVRYMVILRDILEDDRPFVETTSIIGPTTREYY